MENSDALREETQVQKYSDCAKILKLQQNKEQIIA